MIWVLAFVLWAVGAGVMGALLHRISGDDDLFNGDSDGVLAACAGWPLTLLVLIGIYLCKTLLPKKGG